MKITQNSKKLLKWFIDKYRVGKINVNRNTFDWLIRDQQTVSDMLKLLIPYLKVKRKQAEMAITILDKIKNCSSKGELLVIARKADALAKLNVRSKNRRKNNAQAVKEHFSRND